MPKQLFTDEAPDFYLMTQIYDPDTNTAGQIIPQINSIVLDNILNKGVLYRVISVNESTYKVEYEPVKANIFHILKEEENQDENTTLVDYGNTQFFLFYDKKENPTKLNVDSKLYIYGKNNHNYRIVKKLDNGQEVPISLYFDNNNVLQGEFVPLILVDTTENIKYFTNCHTTENIEDGNVYFIQVFDYAGTQVEEIQVHAKQAINSIEATVRIITDFTVSASQMIEEDFYLYVQQDPTELVITPKITYNDGKIDVLPIDNERCFLYGLDDFTPSFPGQETTLLIKYFLDNSQLTSLVTNVDTTGNFLMVEKKLKVIRNTILDDYSSKISVIPYWNNTLNKYELRFFLYTINQYITKDVTSQVLVEGDFNGLDMNSVQHLQLTLDLQPIYNLEEPLLHIQDVYIRLAPYQYIERYIIYSDENDEYGKYGVDTPALRRPMIHYNSTNETYSVSNTLFTTKTLFLEAFYYKSRPLYDTNKYLEPPTPSHFLIREINTGASIITEPIEVDQYNDPWSIIDSNPANLVNRNTILEFLLKDNDDNYYPIYGVPVDVYNE